MRGIIINGLILSTPTWLLVLVVIVHPTHGAGDILAYVLIWALSTLCALGFILPIPPHPDDIDIPETLSVLPPADPGDEWDTEETWALPRHWLWEDEQ